MFLSRCEALILPKKAIILFEVKTLSNGYKYAILHIIACKLDERY